MSTTNVTSLFIQPGTLNVGIGTSQPRAKLEVAGSIVPSSNVEYDLGSATLRWRDLYLSGNSINLGGTTISRDATTGGIKFIDPATNQPLDSTVRNLTASNLTVLGDYVTLNTITSNTEQMVISNAGTGPALKVTQTGANSIAEFYDDGNALALKIADGGNVGIGTATPLSTFHVLTYDTVEREFPPLPFNNSMTVNTGGAASSTTLTVTGHLYGNGTYTAFDTCVASFLITTQGSWAAFDKSNSTYYSSCGSFTDANATSAGVPVSLYLPTPIRVTKYSIYQPANLTTNPKSWIFQGLDSVWVTIDSQTNITWTVNEEKTFIVSTTLKFKDYRWSFTQTNGSTTMILYEARLFGYIQNEIKDSSTTQVHYTTGLITTGNVGIGTSNPQAKLHVNGNIYVSSGNIRVSGKIEVVHKRPMFGINNLVRTTSLTGSTPTTLIGGNMIYGPYGYAIPTPQQGATRYFRIYAVYSDNIINGVFPVIRIVNTNNSSLYVDYNIESTYGDTTGAHSRDSYSNMSTATFGSHGLLQAYIPSSAVGASNAAAIYFFYIELQTLDVF